MGQGCWTEYLRQEIRSHSTEGVQTFFLFYISIYMALRLMPSLGRRRVISLVCSYIKIGGLWGQLSQIPWHPSSSSSSSSNVLHRCGSSFPALAATESAKKNLDHDKALCGGTSIYRGAHKDEWIITLAKFAVDNHNENRVIPIFHPPFPFPFPLWLHIGV